MNALEKVRSIVTEIRAVDNPMKILEQWALAGRLLSRMPTDQKAVAEAVKNRDLDALNAIVSALENPTPKTEPQKSAPEVTQADMEAALKAFKKRLKLARLADESKLGGHYTTGGKQSQIDAIVAPTEFRPEVWKALEKAGRLRHTGQGFYALP